MSSDPKKPKKKKHWDVCSSTGSWKKSAPEFCNSQFSSSELNLLSLCGKRRMYI
jgi:hypothetical protein